MNKFSFWQKWLFVVGLLITVFGLMMAFFNGTPLFALFNSQVDPPFWGTEGIAENARTFQQWIYGVLGATVAGWGIFLAFIARYPFRKREKWSWNCLVLGLLLWYSIDTAISLNFNVYFNAAFNTILLTPVMLPVIFTRKYLVQ